MQYNLTDKYLRDLEHYRKLTIKNSRYKPGDRVKVYLKHSKRIATVEIKQVQAQLKNSPVIEFDLYYDCVGRNGRMPFICQSQIKGKLKC